MFVGCRSWVSRALLGFWCLGRLSAGPPLTTIQDVLYKADGTPFKGVAFIEWKSFEASDQSNIATHTLAVPILNGVLRVKLVPTTTATPAGTYTVRYNSDGKIQFEEKWSVPPSTAPLRIKDVRVAGPVTPPPPLSEPIEESDVTGLVADLEIRPVKGPGYAASRAAFINASGALEAVVGDLNDCVRVDGTAGPCGTGGVGGAVFIDAETPSGALDGLNRVFALSGAPEPASGLALYRNGLLQKQGADYTVSGNTITFAAGATPQPGDLLVASYRVASSAGPNHTVPQVLCSSAGAGTSATVLTSLGACTIPANLLQPGDRVELRFDYSHQGATTGFAIEVRWGATTLVAREADPGESAASGTAGAGITAGGAQWSVQSWGSALSLTAGAGTAGDSLASALPITFLGRMTAETTETVRLENFMVIRYPAQANP